MILILLVFLGGALTILSPCILPVLPFVFARSDQRFLTSGLPMLAGMAVTFAGIASLAAVGGAWAVRVNQYGRLFALVLLTLFAITLLSRPLADWMSRPFVAMGNRLVSHDGAGAGAGEGKARLLSSLLLGVATGLLWAPCAGPILGLVLTGAALSGPNTHTTALLFAYSAGAATSLGVALLAGGRVFAAMKKSLGAGEYVRRALGVAVLIAVAAIAMGWDSTILTQASLAGTNKLEQSLLDTIRPVPKSAPASSSVDHSVSANKLPIEGELPSLSGATAWLNSPPLSPESLRGKVVLVDFWTYSCINCLRTLPYVKAWYGKYKDHGLVVVGVHTPEFAFEKNPENVRRAVSDLGVAYPVALDDDYAIWRAFNNQYWPADYFIDSDGHIRAHHFGEGEYEEVELTLRQLLTAAGNSNLPVMNGSTAVSGGVQAAADLAHVQSPETYVGYERAANFSSPGGFAKDRRKIYSVPGQLTLNQWGLAGAWIVDAEKAASAVATARIVFRFNARDLHLVLGPGKGGKPVHYRVTLDGAAPAANHGADTDANGDGVVDEQRLYQLIRQSSGVGEHTFSIEFIDSDVQAYAFTFG